MVRLPLHRIQNGKSIQGDHVTQLSIEDYLKTARYEGPVNAEDCARLEGQTRKIFDLMKDGCYRTLAEIEMMTGYPQASISAQLRHLRKLRFGGNQVDKRRRDGGQWEYQLISRIQ
jgi:hypothetical protein